MSDIPLQRNLKIGKVTVGLVGIDVALNRVVSDSSLTERAAADLVFSDIKKNNYIPASAEDSYLAAITQEIKRLRAGTSSDSGELIIRILGPGCVSCNNIQKMVFEVMAKLDVAADIFQIHDLDEIGRHGILSTPALIINDKIKCSGRIPTSSQIEEWLRAEINI